MNADENLHQQKIRDAGEQAGRVLGEFISIAEDFSKRFEREFSAKGNSCQRKTDHHSSHNDSCVDAGVDPGSSQVQGSEPVKTDYKSSDNPSDPNNNQHSGESNPYYNAGEFLRQLRENAGETIDGFSRSPNGQDADHQANSVEAGHDRFPDEWLHQISALLTQNDPLEFIKKLSQLYESETSAETADSKPDNTTALADGVADQRKHRLNSIFSDEQFQNLTDKQFEELSGFVESSYQTGLKLIRNQ